MGDFLDWLFEDRNKNLYEFLVALVLNGLFLLLLAVIAWPLGLLPTVLRLAAGYAALWLAVWLGGFLLSLVFALLRRRLEDHLLPWLIANVVLVCIILVFWSAFLGSTLRSGLGDAPLWSLVLAAFAGLLAAYVGFIVVGAFFQGSLYRWVALPLAVAGFLLFYVCLPCARWVFFEIRLTY